MKYTLTFEKQEYDEHIQDIKSTASDEGFWKAVDILYKISTTEKYNYQFGSKVDIINKSKFNQLCDILKENYFKIKD